MISYKPYYEYLINDAAIVELRHFTENKQIVSRLFDDPETLHDTVINDCQKGNVYTTINKPQKRVVTDKWGVKALGNNDIDRIVRLPFDFDPVRPKNVNASDDEINYALAHAMALKKYLEIFKWPEPLLAFSGNGVHLQYRIALPNTPEVTKDLKLLYRFLKDKFNSEEVTFDTTVRNAGRILRAYGSYNHKAISTDERPSRQSTCEVPQKWQQVSHNAFESLMCLVKQNETQKQSFQQTVRSGERKSSYRQYENLDVCRWFHAHGLYLWHIIDNVHACICPWENEHTTQRSVNDCCIFVNDYGCPGFHCKHAHCENRSIMDVIDLFGDADNFC